MAKNTKNRTETNSQDFRDQEKNAYETDSYEKNKSKNGYKQNGNTRDCHKNQAEDTWETDKKY